MAERDDLNLALQETTAKADELERALETATVGEARERVRAEKAEMQVTALTRQLQTSEEARAVAEKRAASSSQMIESLEKQLAKANAREKSLEESLKNTQEQLEYFKDALSSAREELAAANAEAQRLKSIVDSQAAEIKETREQVPPLT